MMVGQKPSKGGSESDGTERFADLLQGTEKNIAEDASKVEAFKQEKSDAKTKLSQNGDNKEVSPDKTKDVKNKKADKQEAKTSSSGKDKTQTQKKSTENQAEAPENLDAVSKSVNPEETVSANENVGEVADVSTEAVANIEMPEEIIAGMNIADIIVTEEMTVPTDVSNVLPIAENNVTPQMVDEALPAADVAPVVMGADDSEEKMIVADANNTKVAPEQVATKDEASVAFNPDSGEAVKVAEKDVVRVQEEKIAEKLPEGEKIEIKVSVKNDTVTPHLEKERPITLLNELEEPVELNQDQLQLSETKVSVNSVVSNIPAQQKIEAETVNVAKLSDVQEVSAVKAETIAQATPMVEEVLTTRTANPNPVLETNNFKDAFDKGLTREIAEQVKVNITQSAIKGVDKIEIQLKPADLGQVEIKLQIARDGRIQAHITASNAETLDVLQKDLSSLKEAFESAGYQTEDGSFSFSYRGEGQENNEREQMRRFIGEVIVRETAEELAANDYITSDGVNIRV